MKKFFHCMVLVLSITGTAFAQKKKHPENLFDLSPSFAQRRFFVDMGKGNTLQIELNDPKDLERFINMDSVIRVLLSDMVLLKDSMGDELLSRRIDHITDPDGSRKIRIQRFKPKGSNFLVQQGEAAALKLAQDTINVTGEVRYIAKYTLRKAFSATRHYRLSFYLNDLQELAGYMNGNLNGKVRLLQEQLHSSWSTLYRGGGTYHRGRSYLVKDSSITALLAEGRVGGGNFLNFRFSVDVQNYKAYFVPSFSLGTGLIISSNYFKRDIMLSWDPNFLFGHNSQGTLRTYRNDFVTLTWGQGVVQDNQPRLESHLLFIMSLGYLVNRQGDYFERHTFRVGAGRLSVVGGKTKLEPAFYFNRFFKGVTPAFRWIQSF